MAEPQITQHTSIGINFWGKESSWNWRLRACNGIHFSFYYMWQSYKIWHLMIFKMNGFSFVYFSHNQRFDSFAIIRISSIFVPQYKGNCRSPSWTLREVPMPCAMPCLIAWSMNSEHKFQMSRKSWQFCHHFRKLLSGWRLVLNPKLLAYLLLWKCMEHSPGFWMLTCSITKGSIQPSPWSALSTHGCQANSLQCT